MLYYNWKRIMRLSERKSCKIISAIESMLQNKPSSYFAKHLVKNGIDLKGTSYLLNPEPLVAKRYLWGSKHTAEYIGLAALRNIVDYTVFGDKSLEIEKSPIPIEKLKSNKLLTIRNGRIYFYYEELYTNGKNRI